MTSSFDTLPDIVPPLPRQVDHNRNLPAGAGFRWLGLGWKDLWAAPVPSLAYGLAVALASGLVVAGMLRFGWDQVLFPALAGFLVIGPVLATGLYEKSRLLEAGETPRLRRMLLPASLGGLAHILFVGAVLMTLMLVWTRAAVLLYALFFGWLPFPGLGQILPVILGTPLGLSFLAVGTLVGGLFAALAFAISAFSIPMVLDREVDTFTAMGTSMSLVWNNLPALLVWGAIVAVLILVCLATAFVGLILIFPLLGHATWHAYRAVARDAGA